jgi:hypothetical protein
MALASVLVVRRPGIERPEHTAFVERLRQNPAREYDGLCVSDKIAAFPKPIAEIESTPSSCPDGVTGQQVHLRRRTATARTMK